MGQTAGWRTASCNTHRSRPCRAPAPPTLARGSLLYRAHGAYPFVATQDAHVRRHPSLANIFEIVGPFKDSRGDFIRVKDNSIGMSEPELKNHWSYWIEPDTAQDFSVVIRNVDTSRWMIANPPFKNVPTTTNPAHSGFELESV